ncbi:Pericentriolar material 1 protein [Merluccius polli]|uniref:Pericentriolar material 1 protein n=1 Tax=Merluccius polli TaxID=89951 RepID=A0AA47MXL0_MERPO|nr:Pericentriolar material 1 protein [Merluccius polli]
MWSEMRRHQILREELRERRKRLESLMAEQQRRSGSHAHGHSPCRSDRQQEQPFSGREVTQPKHGLHGLCIGVLHHISYYSQQRSAIQKLTDH